MLDMYMVYPHGKTIEIRTSTSAVKQKICLLKPG